MVEITANCLFDLGMKKETDNFCKEMLKNSQIIRQSNIIMVKIY